MAATIRRVECWSTIVPDVPGEAYRLLARLARGGVSLLAFGAVPSSSLQTQLLLYAEESGPLRKVLADAGRPLIGPERAFLISGDDEIGALVELHRKLYDAGVNLFVSNGVTDGRGGYGYVLQVRSEDFDQAALVLGV